MVQAKLDVAYIQRNELPADFLIRSVKEKVGMFVKNGKEITYTYYALELVDNTKQIYPFDVKFNDKNYLINTVSPETDEWVGKTITLGLDDKKYIRIDKVL